MARTHAAGELRPGETRALTWTTDRADRTPNELEVWYPGADTMGLSLHAPDGTLVARVARQQERGAAGSHELFQARAGSGRERDL